MALLSKADIDLVDDRRYEDVPVQEWGGEVRVLGLSGTARDQYETGLLRFGPNGKVIGRDLKNARAKLLVKCLVDADMNRLYSEADAAELGKKDGAVLDRLYEVARRLSGIGSEAVEAKAGNSASAQSGASTSG